MDTLVQSYRQRLYRDVAVEAAIVVVLVLALIVI